MITAHADVVGSLLRRPWLLAAEERFRAGQIARPGYKKVEDRAVDEVVAQAVKGFGDWDNRGGKSDLGAHLGT